MEGYELKYGCHTYAISIENWFQNFILYQWTFQDRTSDGAKIRNAYIVTALLTPGFPSVYNN